MSNTNGDYISREQAVRRWCGLHCGCEPDECGHTLEQDGTEHCTAVDSLLEIPAADVRPAVLINAGIETALQILDGINEEGLIPYPLYSELHDAISVIGEIVSCGADMRPAPEPPKYPPDPICQTCGNFEVCAWHEEGVFSGPKDEARRVVACFDYKNKSRHEAGGRR